MTNEPEDKLRYIVRCGIFEGSTLIGSYWPEREDKDTDLHTTLADLISGQFNHPLQVICFNPAEHVCDDFSEDAARAIAAVADNNHKVLNRQIFEFCENHLGCQAMVGIPHD